MEAFFAHFAECCANLPLFAAHFGRKKRTETHKKAQKRTKMHKKHKFAQTHATPPFIIPPLACIVPKKITSKIKKDVVRLFFACFTKVILEGLNPKKTSENKR